MFVIKTFLVLGLNIGAINLATADVKNTNSEVKTTLNSTASSKDKNFKTGQQQSSSNKKKPNMVEYCRKYTC